PAPTFPKLRRREQPINDVGKCVVAVVRQESFYVFRFGRQPCQVERSAANQRALIRRPAGFKPSLLQLGQNEIIDRTARPLFVFYSGRSGAARGQESPMVGA